MPKITSSVLSAAVLASALGVLWVGNSLSNHQSDTVIVRQVDVAMTTPPPPPPASQQVAQASEITMNVQGSGASIEVSDVAVETDITVAQPTKPVINASMASFELPDITFDAFGLNELDGTPTLLTPVKVEFPKRLKMQGVTKVVVKLDVMIDEQGDVELLDIVENPHHELNKEIIRVVDNSKFTAPFKEDEAVKARFIWPIVIEA